MSTPVGATTAARNGITAARVVLAGAVIGASILIGHSLAVVTSPMLHSKMLPWILTRGLGLASFICLTGLTVLGLWVRHPWRNSVPGIRPTSILRAHSGLAAATVALVVAHLIAVALDSYAHVGWLGALVPWESAYRTNAVALGTLSLWGMVLVGVTASLAGYIGGKRWLAVHRLAWVTFVLVWLHGVTAGSDTIRLRLVYGICGSLVAFVAVTRSWATKRAMVVGRPRIEVQV